MRPDCYSAFCSFYYIFRSFSHFLGLLLSLFFWCFSTFLHRQLVNNWGRFVRPDCYFTLPILIFPNQIFFTLYYFGGASWRSHIDSLWTTEASLWGRHYRSPHYHCTPPRITQLSLFERKVQVIIEPTFWMILFFFQKTKTVSPLSLHSSYHPTISFFLLIFSYFS